MMNVCCCVIVWLSVSCLLYSAATLANVRPYIMLNVFLLPMYSVYSIVITTNVYTSLCMYSYVPF